jgi:hypothetical protein
MVHTVKEIFRSGNENERFVINKAGGKVLLDISCLKSYDGMNRSRVYLDLKLVKEMIHGMSVAYNNMTDFKLTDLVTNERQNHILDHNGKTIAIFPKDKVELARQVLEQLKKGELIGDE